MTTIPRFGLQQSCKVWLRLLCFAIGAVSCGTQSEQLTGSSPHAGIEGRAASVMSCGAVQVESKRVEDGLAKVAVSIECKVTAGSGVSYAKLLKALVDEANSRGTIVQPAVDISENGLSGKSLLTHVVSNSSNGDTLERVVRIHVLSDLNSRLISQSATESISGTGEAGRMKSLNSSLEFIGQSQGTLFVYRVKNYAEIKKPALISDSRFLELILERQLPEVESKSREMLNQIVLPNL